MKITIETSREEVEAGLDFLARPKNEEFMKFLGNISPMLLQQVFSHFERNEPDHPEPDSGSE